MNKEEGKKLLAKLRKCDAAYYSGDESLISDDRYDALKKKLAKSFPNLKYLQEVGAEIVGKKATLPIELGGFKQLRPSEVDKWTKEINKKYGKLISGPITYLVLPKLDGISCLLEYKKIKGVYTLTAAYTRGRIKPGETEQKGKPVLRHIRLVQGAPRTLEDTTGIYKKLKYDTIYIRGELICHLSLFNKNIKGVALPHKKEGYTNPRGFVSGVFNRDDISGFIYKKLLKNITFVAFGVIAGDKSINKIKQLHMLSAWEVTNITNPSRINSKYNKFRKDNGLEPVRLKHLNPPRNLILNGYSDTEILDLYSSNRETLDLNQDGLVIEVADAEIRNVLGKEGNFPEYAKKIKPEREQQLSKIGILGKIEWTYTSRRHYKPVGILKEPVDFNGIKFTRAFLHNAKNVKDMNLEIGCKVVCLRAGDTIPYISGRADD